MLRQWRWERLRGRVKPAGEASARPGNQAVAGAALYRAGLNAQDEDRAAQGLRQLLAGAEQAIAPSGVTREGSTPRQAQLARLFAECWLTARRAGRPEQWRLAAVARSVLGALDALTLAGGLPEIGEAPDDAGPRPPFDHLDESDRRAVEELRRQARLYDLESLRPDGWLRLDSGAWSGLWHCPPTGWPEFGGLTHHDLGAAELHWNGLPLFVDPGTPPPAQAALRPLYRSAIAHGGLTLDGKDPYPENRPDYSDAFRRAVAGPPPELRTRFDGVTLSMDGFGRFGGHRQIERHWRFDGVGLRIEDSILGTGRPLIERRLITPWTVSREDSAIVLTEGEHRLRLSGDAPVTLHPAKLWTERGEERPLTMILFATSANLPWSGALTLQPVSP